MKQNKTNPTNTILTISVGFIVIYLITRWSGAIYVSLIIGLIGIFSSYLSEKIDWLWMKLAWVLSFIVPNILLSGVFYLILFPVSVLSKVFGAKDPLILKNEKDSVFREPDKKFDRVFFEKTW